MYGISDWRRLAVDAREFEGKDLNGSIGGAMRIPEVRSPIKHVDVD